MNTPAPETPGSGAMKILCAQTHHRGFSLLELLVVIVIIAILFGMTVPAFQRLIAGMAPRLAAEEFTSGLRSARQYAMDNNVRTRVVFADSELESNAPVDAKIRARSSFGVYAFHIPSLSFGATELQRLHQDDPARAEFAPFPSMSIPAGFVGQWIPCPAFPDWRTPRGSVEVVSELLGGLAPPATLALDEATLRSNFYNPPRTWKRGVKAGDFFPTTNKAAAFPENFWQTPYPRAYGFTTVTNLAGAGFAQEESAVLVAGTVDEQVTYANLWPPFHTYRFFNVYSEFGSAGAAANGVGVVDEPGPDRRFYNLPGIEFNSQGVASFASNSARFLFRDRKQTNNAIEVWVDKISGAVRTRVWNE